MSRYRPVPNKNKIKTEKMFHASRQVDVSDYRGHKAECGVRQPLINTDLFIMYVSKSMEA